MTKNKEKSPAPPVDSSPPNSIDLEGAISSLKSKPVNATLGWAIALVLAVAIGYNTLYVKITTILDKTGEVEQLSGKLERLEDKMNMQEMKSIQRYSFLKDYNGKSNEYKDDFIVLANTDNCDSLALVMRHLNGLLVKNKCDQR